MTARIYQLLTVIAMLSIVACNNSKTEKKTTGTDTLSNNTSAVTPKDSATGTDMKVKVKFNDFQFGDAAHFMFTDEAGKEWEFAQVEDTTAQFAMELPEKEANEKNQGWAVNKSMVGKWYTVTYITREQPLYPDGPTGKVMIITKVSPAE